MLDFILAIIWVVLLVVYIVVTVLRNRNEKNLSKATMELNKVIIEQNVAIREQNAELIKANQGLSTVIVRACSKSVRDRKE